MPVCWVSIIVQTLNAMTVGLQTVAIMKILNSLCTRQGTYNVATPCSNINE